MKKYISLFLALTIILSLTFVETASAEEFTLHGGVTFNMTVDEMIATETANGLTPVKITDGSLYFSGYYGYDNQYDLSAYSTVYEITGSFISDGFTRIYYMFDADGKLCQMIYCGTADYKTDSDVAQLNNALAELYKNKYGEPSSTYHEISGVTTVKNLPSMIIAPAEFLRLCDSYYQWMYKYNDEFIADIEIQSLQWIKWSSSGVYYSYSPVISYTRITVDDYNQAIQSEQDNAQQTMDDI